VRYADDGNIHVRNRRAVGLQPTGLTRGERVMASVASFLTGRLKLRLNAAKSAVDRPEHRKVLGFSFKIGPMPKRRIAPAALVRFKERVRDLTRRDCGNSLDTMTKSRARYLIGWRGYFGFSELPSELRRLDKWIRRRLRAIARKQWKRGRKRYKELRRRGVDHDRAARTAGSGHSPWRMALTPPCILPCPTLSSPPSACLPLWSGPHNPMNRRVRDPYARWWGRGSREAAPYPDPSRSRNKGVDARIKSAQDDLG
jgi:RNA-directed DNA polymerase